MTRTFATLTLLAAALLTAVPFANASQTAQTASSSVAPEREQVVYHINDSAVARVAMNNVTNHLGASPDARIVVVTHGRGIDFLLHDARDDRGTFAPAVAALKARGVEFRVCRNTLRSRNLGDDAAIMEASVVPSGVAEIGRLQAREGFVYLKP